MPTLLRAWTASEPEVGSAIDTLRIATIGHLPAKTDPIRTRFPFDGLGLVLRGSGFYRVDDGPARLLRAPAVFRIWPGPLFHYGPDAGTTWEERFLCFTGTRVADWLRWGWLPRSDRLQEVAGPDALAQWHRRISQAFPPFRALPLDQAKLECEQLVHELYRQAAARSSQPDKQAGLAALIERWMKEPARPGGLRDAARGLGMSYAGFRQHFARRTGLTPHRFLLRLRIDQACLRLARTDDPVKAIAADSGFAFVESFNRAFLQIKEMTPGEYRKRMALLTREGGEQATPAPRRKRSGR